VLKLADDIITVRIKGRAADQLKELKAHREAKTNSEVVRNALRTYKALQSYIDTRDDSVIIERSDGKRIKLILP